MEYFRTRSGGLEKGFSRSGAAPTPWGRGFRDFQKVFFGGFQGIPRGIPRGFRGIPVHFLGIPVFCERKNHMNLAQTIPTVAYAETAEGFAERLQEAADFANANYDGPGLCRELNSRLKQLVKETHGDRLPKWRVKTCVCSCEKFYPAKSIISYA